MNGYANADTFFAANFVLNTESVLISAKRFINAFQIRNLLNDAQLSGMMGDDIDIENVECEEILDAVLGE